MVPKYLSIYVDRKIIRRWCTEMVFLCVRCLSQFYLGFQKCGHKSGLVSSADHGSDPAVSKRGNFYGKSWSVLICVGRKIIREMACLSSLVESGSRLLCFYGKSWSVTYSAIHKAAVRPTAAQNGVWRAFCMAVWYFRNCTRQTSGMAVNCEASGFVNSAVSNVYKDVY